MVVRFSCDGFSITSFDTELAVKLQTSVACRSCGFQLNLQIALSRNNSIVSIRTIARTVRKGSKSAVSSAGNWQILSCGGL